MSEPDPEPQQRAAQLQVEVVLAAEPVIESDDPIADHEPGMGAPGRRLEPVAEIADEPPVEPVARWKPPQVTTDAERGPVVDRQLSAHADERGSGGEAVRDRAGAQETHPARGPS